MQVTDIKVFSTPSGRTKGYGSVEFDKQIRINFSVFSKKDNSGDYVVWPQYASKKETGKYVDQVFFMDTTLRQNIQSQVLTKLQGTKSGTPSSSPSTPVGEAPGFDSSDEIPF